MPISQKGCHSKMNIFPPVFIQESSTEMLCSGAWFINPQCCMQKMHLSQVLTSFTQTQFVFPQENADQHVLFGLWGTCCRCQVPRSGSVLCSQGRQHSPQFFPAMTIPVVYFLAREMTQKLEVQPGATSIRPHCPL